MRQERHQPRARRASVSFNTHPSAHLGSIGQQIQSHGGGGVGGGGVGGGGWARPSSSAFPMSLTSSRHPFTSGEVEECDKYNPLVLHHTQIQSKPQHHESRAPLNKASPLPIKWDNEHYYTHATTGDQPRGSRPHRHSLLCTDGLCDGAGKMGVLKPKASSAAATTMSIAVGHSIISPSGSSSATSTSFSTSASTASTHHSNAFKDPNFQAQSQRSPSNRRMSLPEPPPMDRSLTRRMSHTVTSPPKLLDTIYQRVWNPQQKTPGTKASPLAVTDDELLSFGMTDSQLVKQQTKQDWDQPKGIDYSTSPLRFLASTSFVGSASPCFSSPRGKNSGGEGQQARLFKERFILQVTFSLDENHKSGLQAILALRQLTNGLTSVKVTPTPRVIGTRASPTIPIPRISHRFPESTTVVVNGKTRVVNKKTVPSVLISWSDGVSEEFDPSGMTLDEILARCHYPTTSS